MSETAESVPTSVGGSAGRTPESGAAGGSSARARILSAAGELMAGHGIEGVSMREITREAGQKNSTALQYHFGGREGMLRALVDLYVPRISLRRHTLLDHLATRDDLTLRDGASMLATPLIAELADPGGRDFLQVAAQLVNRSDQLVEPSSALGSLVYDAAGSLTRWSSVIERFMPRGTAGPPLHRRYAALRFTHLELGRRARVAPNGTHELFSAQLIDLVAALLGAELSPETRSIMAERHPEVEL